MIAAGVLFYTISTKRILFLLRNNTRTKGTWGMPGGKINRHEYVMNGLTRELLEELGKYPTPLKIIPLEKFTSMDKTFCYYSYVYVIEKEFMPTLNDEHCGYAWSSIDKFPRPLHPGLFQTINISVIQEKIRLIEELI